MSKKLTTEEFIARSKTVHGDKYDYSNVNYINNRSKVCITCSDHGEFWQRPDNHMRGETCLKCSIYDKILTTDEFVKKSNITHKHTYDYTNSIYKHNTIDVCISCNIHGEFWQNPMIHIKGSRCPKCVLVDKSYDTSHFIHTSSKLHNNKYTYNNSVYINKRTKICITCKTHGDFYQYPYSHMRGNGCPKCKRSIGEEIIENVLTSYNIQFNTEHTFKECKYKKCLPFDFYLPNNNMCIEFDGEQHFKPIPYFGGDSTLQIQKIKDSIKDEYCKLNNIHLLRIPYSKLTHIEQIIKNELHL